MYFCASGDEDQRAGPWGEVSHTVQRVLNLWLWGWTELQFLEVTEPLGSCELAVLGHVVCQLQRSPVAASNVGFCPVPPYCCLCGTRVWVRETC